MSSKQRSLQAVNPPSQLDQDVADVITEAHATVSGAEHAADAHQALSDAELAAASVGAETAQHGIVAGKTKFAFKKVKSVAVQMFKAQPDVQRFFLIDGPMFKGKEVSAAGKAKMAAPDILPVTDLETGEEGQYIIGKVLKELLAENYPDNGYVGRKFAVTPRKRADKNYNTYDFVEIET